MKKIYPLTLALFLALTSAEVVVGRPLPPTNRQLSPAKEMRTNPVYWLDPAAFIAKMQELLRLASHQTISGSFLRKWVQAGRPYEEGDVAYFGESDPSSGGRYLQLEEWRLQPDGYFIVTYTKITLGRAERWRIKTTRTGTILFDKKGIPTEELRPSEVMIESARAQELLMKFGQPMVDR